MPQLELVSPEVANLFERAFADCSPANPPGRPSATAWRAALASLERSLVTCKISKGHKHFSKLNKCPWCVIATNAGFDFFITVDPDLANWTPHLTDIGKLLSEIRKLLNSSDQLVDDLANFSAGPPKPLPCSPPKRPLLLGSPPDETRLSVGLPSRPLVPEVQLPTLLLAPKPSKPIPSIPPPMRPPIRSLEIQVMDELAREAGSGFFVLGLLLGSPFLIIIHWRFPGVFAVVLSVVVVFSWLALNVVDCIKKTHEKNKEAISQWRQRLLKYEDAYRQDRATESAEFAEIVSKWVESCKEIESENQALMAAHRMRQNAILADHDRSQKMAEQQWENDNRLLLKKWRDDLQVEKLNWFQKKEEYERLSIEFEKKLKTLRDEREHRRNIIDQTEKEIASLQALQSSDAKSLEQFKTELQTIESNADRTWTKLKQEYRDEVHASENVAQQLEDYLRKKPIPRDLTGIGPSRYNSLITAGITSAADCSLSDLLNVRGIGMTYASTIFAWSEKQRKQFQPKKHPTPTAQRMRINAKFGGLANKLEVELRKCLSTNGNGVVSCRRNISERHERIVNHKKTLIQAKVDLSALENL